MIWTISAAFLIGILNGIIVRFVFLKDLAGSNRNFLFRWGLAFLYKLGFLAVCFLIFYKLDLPYTIIFFTILIFTQVITQITLTKRDK